MTVTTQTASPNSLGAISSLAQSPPLLTAPSLDDFQKSRDAQELGRWALEQYQRAKSDRLAIQRQWQLNLAFYYGKQFYSLLPGVPGQPSTAGKLYKAPAPPWRTRMAVNHVRRVVRREMARLTSQKPSASVIPASSEDEDLFAAYAGEQVWESFYATRKIRKHFRRSVWWMCLTGTGFMKTYWDPNKVDTATELMGDIVTGPVTPYHLFVPDLREEEIEDQPWVFNVYTKPVSWVEQFFGDKAPKGLTPNVVSVNEIMDDAVLNIQGGSNAKPDSVLIIEAWVKPGAHRLLPEGGLLTFVGEQLVSGSINGLPYNHGEYPFTKFEHIPTGKFYGESSITDLIPLQREYNRTRGQIIDNKNAMAKLQLLAPKGSVNPAKITSQPGQVIEYNPGFAPPQPMPLQALPSYVLEEQDRILSDMDDISGQHEVSKGSTPPGVTAATAISFLQEQDDTLLATTYQSVEEGMEKIARQTLTLAVQFWELPRIIKVTGTDNSFDAMMLKGAQLKSGTDIRMEGGSSLPTSKAARQAFIMDMMKFGWIPPQEGLRILEIGGVQRLYDQLKIDERHAQRENMRMKVLDAELISQHETAHQQSAAQAQGMGGELPESPPIIPVNSWDNHAVHIDVHNRFRKSQAFELLAPEIQAQFEKHVRYHAEALNQAMMGAMEMGMPPELGGDQMSGGGEPGMPGEGGDNGGANQFQPPIPGI